tara:strand:+ start:630 stop:1472 length:843 start_codon:yes stop_codon:yes gene_type:complete
MVFTGVYAIPVSGDKIFRSPRYGQQQLRAVLGVKKIIVDDRNYSFVNTNGVDLVRVQIIAETKRAADGCFQKGKRMILNHQKSNPPSPVTPKKFFYDVPVDGDKVFRSPKHGQVYLRQKYPDCRIRVGERIGNNPMVRVVITSTNQMKANSLFNEGMTMVRKLLESQPKKELVPENSNQDIFEEWVRDVENLIQTRETTGIYDHTECHEVMGLISIREQQGITDHSELGLSWETRPFLWVDELVNLEPGIENLSSPGSWAVYDELRTTLQSNNPEYYISG